MSDVLFLLFPSTAQVERGSEKLSDVPGVGQLLRGRAELKPVCDLEAHILLPATCCVDGTHTFVFSKLQEKG